MGGTIQGRGYGTNDPKNYPKAGDIVIPPLKPSDGRSTVNNELKRIWGLHDAGAELTVTDFEYIRDYYKTQFNYWDSKSEQYNPNDMYDNPLRDCAKERQELAWINESLRQDNKKLNDELTSLKDSYGFVR